MAKAKKATAGKINADTMRWLSLLDAGAMAAGEAGGAATNAQNDVANALRLLGYRYATESESAAQSLKARVMRHHGAGWLKGRGLMDNQDAVRGVTLDADGFKALEGKASDLASPKGRADVYRQACMSAGLMLWRRAADAADPDGAVRRKAEQAAKRDAAGKAPKVKAAPKKVKGVKVDAALQQAFDTIAKDAALTRAFMAWAAQHLPDIT
jgi:hypothetical protein